MNVPDVDGPESQSPESLDRARREVEALWASRERLVLASDAWSRDVERELHDGLQQRLVAIAVKLQRASELDRDSMASALGELERDVQGALDETARLAERIHPPLLELGLPAALRSAAVSAAIAATVEGGPGSGRYPPEVARTVLLAWQEALRHPHGDRPVAISIREEDDALVFEIVSDARIDWLRDRVEALGGRMAVDRAPDGGTRASGSIPLARSS